MQAHADAHAIHMTFVLTWQESVNNLNAGKPQNTLCPGNPGMFVLACFNTECFEANKHNHPWSTRCVWRHGMHQTNIPTCTALL